MVMGGLPANADFDLILAALAHERAAREIRRPGLDTLIDRRVNENCTHRLLPPVPLATFRLKKDRCQPAWHPLRFHANDTTVVWTR